MTFVFLGPSLPLNEAKKLLDAHYLPPAKQGDIISLVEEKKPKIIALIDGFFFQALSVWHKEILYALKKGVVVMGASSMGALRAAETERYGMIGVGEIFRLYKEGLSDDDEVAILHAPLENGYLNLSLAMVNIRFTIKKALASGLLSSKLAEQILQKAKKLHFTERAVEAICNGLPSEAKHILQSHYCDQKKEDARLLLQLIAENRIPVISTKEPLLTSSQMRPIYYQERAVDVEGVKLQLGMIAKHVALHHSEFSLLKRRALNRILVDILANILNIEVDEKETDEEERKFRKSLARISHQRASRFGQSVFADGNTDVQSGRMVGEKSGLDDLEEWLKNNHLSYEDFRELMHAQARAQKLYRSPFGGQRAWKFHKAILDELRLGGDYPHWAAQAALVHETTPHYAETTEEDILDQNFLEAQLKETYWNLDEEIGAWCESNGFDSVQELGYEVHRAKLARDAFHKKTLNLLFD